MIRTVKETLQKSGQKCWIVKKGQKYITIRNNELAKTSKLSEAIAFESPEQIDKFLANATIDSRNQQVIGNSYGIAPITKK